MTNVISYCSAVESDGRGCGKKAMPGLPIVLCGGHLRIAYESAQDLVNEGWSGAVTAYVQSLRDSLDYERRKVAVGVRREACMNDSEGVVYFVRFRDRIKIGFTTNLQARLKSIPHDEVLMAIPGSRKEEGDLHRAFADLRENGEWFRAEPDLVRFIDGLQPNPVSRLHGIR